MAPVFPLELLQTINRSCPRREGQLKQLATFFNPNFPSPSTLVAYGLEGTGKLKAVTTILEARAIPHVVVRCKHCLSQRHLLSKIFAAVVSTLEQKEAVDQYDKIDSINALATNLQKLFRDRLEPVVVVIDGIDKQRGTSATLLPALARLGDLISSMSVIMISSSPRPLALHRPGVPYVHFPPYSRDEAISLLNASHKDLIPPPWPSSSSIDIALLSKIYNQFTTAIYDSLVSHTSSTSLHSFKSTCQTLWPRFIHPYLSNQPPPGQPQSQPATWDFAKLLIASRHLFQSEGESALVSRLNPTPSNINYRPLLSSRAPLLKHFATVLLVSAYLASHTPPKFDIVLFSRLSSSSKSFKVKKRRLAQFKSPGKAKSIIAASTSTPSKKSKSSSLYDPKLNVARPFTLERLIAILRAIHPTGIPQKRGIADRVYRELAELDRLRLVVCVSGSGGEDSEERWRVNVGRDMVDVVARRWGVSWKEYEVERD